MTKENNKNINHYKKILCLDTIVLLIVSILFTIITGYIIESKNYDDATPILIKSILFIILEIKLLINRQQIKSLGTMSLITSIIIILTSISPDLFSIIYLMLGIFYLIHSIIYVKKAKNIEKDKTNNNSKLEYLTIIPIIISPVIMFSTYLIQRNIIGILLLIIILIINIISIILGNKYKGSILNFITSTISILIIIVTAILILDEIGFIINKTKTNINYNEEKFIEECKNAENSINDDITMAKTLKELNVRFGEDTIIPLNDYTKIKSNYYLKKIMENDYKCEGYIVLDWKENLKYSSYEEIHYGMLSYDAVNFFENVNTYINCVGKYNYKTPGYKN